MNLKSRFVAVTFLAGMVAVAGCNTSAQEVGPEQKLEELGIVLKQSPAPAANFVPAVGRALTAQYMPLRPDVRAALEKKGAAEGRVGDMVTWPIELLTKGDVYVADSYGKVENGPIIGSNLGTSILSKSGNGVVFNGTVRDLKDLTNMPGFVSFIRGDHPSYQQQMMLKGINIPIRVGPVTVMPGDIVLGYLDGVVFIPPHLAERVVKTGELVLVRDEFGQQRLKEGKYTSGQIDNRWSDEIEKDFVNWLNAQPGKLPFSIAEMQELLKDRTW